MLHKDKLRNTTWLAERLGLSLSTIEKLRSEDSTKLPPQLKFNRTVRYDERTVENWIQKNMDSGQSSEMGADDE